MPYTIEELRTFLCSPLQSAFWSAYDAALPHYRVPSVFPCEPNKRLVRAVNIVVRGSVRMEGKQGWVFRSPQKKTEDAYLVTEQGCCPCKDAVMHQNRPWFCKHAIAVALVRKTLNIWRMHDNIYHLFRETRPKI